MSEQADWPGDLSPADVDVVAGPGGSVNAALAWVEMVLEGRLDESWPLTGARFRLHLTRHWAWNHRFRLHDAGHDPLGVATGLAYDGPAHQLWPAFARSQPRRSPGPAPLAARPVARSSHRSRFGLHSCRSVHPGRSSDTLGVPICLS